MSVTTCTIKRETFNVHVVQKTVPVSCCVQENRDASNPEPVNETLCYRHLTANSSDFIHTQVPHYYFCCCCYCCHV